MFAARLRAGVSPPRPESRPHCESQVRSMNWRSCARRPPVDAEARRPEDQQACAHPRVLYMTEQIEGGRTRGWWACDLCQVKFVPAVSAEYAVAQAARV